MLGALPAQGLQLHEHSPTPLTTDILERIGALYVIEAEVRGQPPDMPSCPAGSNQTAGRRLA